MRRRLLLIAAIVAVGLPGFAQQPYLPSPPLPMNTMVAPGGLNVMPGYYSPEPLPAAAPAATAPAVSAPSAALPAFSLPREAAPAANYPGLASPARPAPGATPIGYEQDLPAPIVPPAAGPSSVYPEGLVPPAASPLPSPAPPAVSYVKMADSTWYTRVDYFHWNERYGGQDFVNESGALFTLGYQRRVGAERFRLELFGGDVHYDGFGQFDDGLESLAGTTRYIGGRGEYDFLVESPWSSDAAFLLGVGTRVWVRDLGDGYTIYGNPVAGYQETWWTIYPYVGLETKQPMGSMEFYCSTRLGLTAFTYEFASDMELPLYPKPGIMGQVDLGFRGEHLSFSCFFEGMGWSQSQIVRDSLQPNSRMYTIGGRLGYTF